jgi:hypothetical protein
MPQPFIREELALRPIRLGRNGRLIEVPKIEAGIVDLLQRLEERRHPETSTIGFGGLGAFLAGPRCPSPERKRDIVVDAPHLS